MIRRIGLLAALAALGVATAALSAPAAPQATKLVGKVGPGFTISLTDESGNPVTTLAPGDYSITVTDQSDEHNFHLFGSGVDRFTEVGFIGTVTWEVTLTDGVYTIQCDPHFTSMRRKLTVGTGGTTTTTTTTTATVPKLVGTVGPAFTISLRNAAGARVKSLKAGAYSVTVRDRAKVHNFHLVGAGVNRRTGVAFVGTTTWKVKLVRGTLRFLCDPHRTTMRGSVPVR